MLHCRGIPANGHHQYTCRSTGQLPVQSTAVRHTVQYNKITTLPTGVYRYTTPPSGASENNRHRLGVYRWHNHATCSRPGTITPPSGALGITAFTVWGVQLRWPITPSELGGRVSTATVWGTVK
ncbi:hypothetical protein AVEN_187912-1 [Araneus ventricosus]|uniref:Uncharacterized protein n=1 Tax=Araneus ventricosus TaxID=182803 RepID=A0A4Y2RYN3_ARAVE|nr:hypothetical protein AVEN_187912-1 [Araneus ventricosus]